VTLKFALTAEEEEALVDELGDALDALMADTCREMGPLWVRVTHRVRVSMGLKGDPNLGFEPSRRLLELSKGMQSKYATFAAWRHAVIWRGVLPRMTNQRQRAAVQTIYFTPYPSNLPPYAWSQSAAEAPGIDAIGGAALAKSRAVDGCAESLELLTAELNENNRGTFLQEIKAKFLGIAVRDSVKDVLKISDREQPGSES